MEESLLRLKTRLSFILLLTALFISGCNSVPEFIFVKPGLTQSEFTPRSEGCRRYGEKSTEVSFGRTILIDLLGGAGTTRRLREQQIATLWRHCMEGFGYMLARLTPEQKKTYATFKSDAARLQFHRELIEQHPDDNEHTARAKAGLPPLYRGPWIAEAEGTVIDLAITNMVISGTVSCRDTHKKIVGLITWDGRVTILGGFSSPSVTGVMPDVTLKAGTGCRSGSYTMLRDTRCSSDGSAVCERYARMRQSQRRAVQMAMSGGVLDHSKTRDEDVPESFQSSPPKPVRAGGSGFVVGRNGLVVTNHHLVTQCEDLRILHGGKATAAVPTISDPVNDLTLLQSDRRFSTEARFAERRPRPGTRVRIAHYRVDGTAQTLHGSISGRTGPNGDIRMVALDTEITDQQVGAPVIGPNGAIVGIAISSRVALRLAGSRKGVSSNSGYAIAPSVVSGFLDTARRNDRDVEPTEAQEPSSPDRFTVGIRCMDDSADSVSRPVSDATPGPVS